MFGRKRQSSASEDEIPEDLLATLPEIGGEEEAVAATTVPVVEVGVEGVPDAHALLVDARRQMEQVVANELGRIEETLGQALRGMASKLRESESELAAMRARNAELERLREQHEKTMETLRSLARS